MVPRSGVPSVRRHRDRTASAQAPASDQCQHGPVPTPWLADRYSAESGGESVSIVCSSPQPSYYLRAEDQRLLVQRCYRFFEARIEQSCVIATLHTQIMCAMDRVHGNRRIRIIKRRQPLSVAICREHLHPLRSSSAPWNAASSPKAYQRTRNN